MKDKTNEQLIEAQLHRENWCRTEGKSKLTNQTAKQEQQANASNTVWGITLRSALLGQIVETLENSIAEMPRRAGSQVGERYSIVENCLGVRFRRKHGELQRSSTNLFDLEVAAHIGLMMCLDYSLLPRVALAKKNSHSTRPTKAMMSKMVAAQLEKQIQFKLAKMNFPKWFAKQAEKAKDKEGGSSTYYVQRRMEQAIKDFRAYCLLNNPELAEGLVTRSWTYEEAQIVGSWIVEAVFETGLFEWKIGAGKGNPDYYLSLTDEGKRLREKIQTQSEEFAFDALPMLITPIPSEGQLSRGFLTTPERDHASPKGWLEVSEQHQRFYDHQETQAFRVNQFTYGLVNQLKERTLMCGSWKFYQRDKHPNPTIAERLGFDQHRFNELETAEQNKLLNADKAALKKAKQERTEAFDHHEQAIKDSLNSERMFHIATKCLEDERFYLPIQVDFRGRYYPKVCFLSYQSNDTGKALLEFADGYEIDDYTRKHLAIHIANCAGEDKKDYSARISWTESRHKEILAVAQMLTSDLAWERGWAVLQSFQGEDVIQLAAAMHEFAELFLLKTRTKTHLPVSIDASCSGQQLIAGQVRCAALAEAVNVLPTNCPQDIYRRVMERFLVLVKQQGGRVFRNGVKEQLQGKIGRAIAKPPVMTGGYGSTLYGQLNQIRKVIVDNDLVTPVKNEDPCVTFFGAKGWELFTGNAETGVKSLWSQAMEDVTQLRATFGWFAEQAELAFNAGKKELLMPLPNGSVIHETYHTSITHQVETFNFGSTRYKKKASKAQINITDPNNNNKTKWRTATTANYIHGLDACVLAFALEDFQHPFYGIHDCVATYAGKPMEDLKDKLREAFVKVSSFSIWDEFRKANDLPFDPATAPPIIGTLDLPKIMESDYLFS